MIVEPSSDTHLVGLGMPSVGAPVTDKGNRASIQCFIPVLSNDHELVELNANLPNGRLATDF